MNTTIHTYKKLYTSTIVLYSDGNCQMKNTCEFHTRETINKMACFLTDTDDDLIEELYENTSDTSFPPGANLYVSSECKTARDTFRNSGYSIVRNPEKAEAIVVPDVRNDFSYKLDFNMVAYDATNDALYLFNIEKPGYLVTQITDKDLANVRNFLKTAKGLEPDEIQRSEIRIRFISKCKELEDVMQDRMLSVPYIQESKVPIKASTQISPETLVFWENIDDMNLLVRTICTSDWMDYPVTLTAFLAVFKGESNWYAYANNDFRRILKQIGYECYWNYDYVFNKSRMITPKDYAMLQSYIFYKLGIDEKGGFVKGKLFEEKIPKELKRYLMSMVAVKPVTIPNKMTLGNISNMLNL